MKYNILHIITIMLGIYMSSMVVSCQDDDSTADIDKENINSNESLGKQDANRWEVPHVRKGEGIYFVSHWADISSTSLNKTLNYSFEYDASVCHTRWVAFTFDNVTRAQTVSRTDAWDKDPSLPSSCRLNPDYFPNGYNRGHLCASADRLYSLDANRQTFYMSNMSPQNGNFNAKYWAVLEGVVRNWGHSKKYNTLYVCKGGTIAPSQISGTLKMVSSSGLDVKVAVPKYYFMAVLGETSSETYQAIGFLMEHRDYGGSYPTASAMQKHAMSIDELESFTGIDFFCNLPDKLEDAVESKYNVNSWTWTTSY